MCIITVVQIKAAFLNCLWPFLKQIEMSCQWYTGRAIRTP